MPALQRSSRSFRPRWADTGCPSSQTVPPLMGIRPVDGPQKGGLSGAGGPDDGDKLSLPALQKRRPSGRGRRLGNPWIPVQISKLVSSCSPALCMAPGLRESLRLLSCRGSHVPLSFLKLVDNLVQLNNLFVVAQVALHKAGARDLDDVGEIGPRCHRRSGTLSGRPWSPGPRARLPPWPRPESRRTRE